MQEYVIMPKGSLIGSTLDYQPRVSTDINLHIPGTDVAAEPVRVVTELWAPSYLPAKRTIGLWREQDGTGPRFRRSFG